MSDSGWRALFQLERPLPSTPATRRLRVLIAVTALAVIVVDLVNLAYAPEGGSALAVRTGWALLRAIGFLVLMRSVRFGRATARPIGLILAATTIFAVARLVQPRHGALVPPIPTVTGLALLIGLCAAVVWQLYRSPEITAHLTRRQPRRYVPPWLLTARIGALSFSALLSVPCLVAAGTLFGDHRIDLAWAVPIVTTWFFGSLVIGFLVSFAATFLLTTARWPRPFLATVAAALLVVQPLLCLLLLGPDGLLRDGAPMVIAALLTLYALWRSRGHQVGRVRPLRFTRTDVPTGDVSSAAPGRGRDGVPA